MTTKTMDGEEYLANLESADEQNYKHLVSEEYIKKSDVLELIVECSGGFSRPAFKHAFEGKLQSLPTINLSVIDEMIEEMLFKGNSIQEIARYSHKMEALQELKKRLSTNK